MKVLKLSGEHGYSYFKYDTKLEKDVACRKVFDLNRQDYIILEPKEAEQLKKIEEKNNPEDVNSFVWYRSFAGYEYEGLEIIEVE